MAAHVTWYTECLCWICNWPETPKDGRQVCTRCMASACGAQLKTYKHHLSRERGTCATHRHVVAQGFGLRDEPGGRHKKCEHDGPPTTDVGVEDPVGTPTSVDASWVERAVSGGTTACATWSVHALARERLRRTRALESSIGMESVCMTGNMSSHGPTGPQAPRAHTPTRPRAHGPTGPWAPWAHGPTGP